jgi:hypothetical protein
MYMAVGTGPPRNRGQPGAGCGSSAGQVPKSMVTAETAPMISRGYGEPLGCGGRCCGPSGVRPSARGWLPHTGCTKTTTPHPTASTPNASVVSGSHEKLGEQRPAFEGEVVAASLLPVYVGVAHLGWRYNAAESRAPFCCRWRDARGRIGREFRRVALRMGTKRRS